MHALRQIRHWSIAWSVTLCWMPNQSDTASTITNLISWFSVFDFTKNIKHTGDEILMCASLCQKLSLYCTILQSYCTNKKGAIFYESQCSLDLNETRNDGKFGDGSGISWTTCKQSVPRSRQTTTPVPHHSFLQAGCSTWRPTNNVNALNTFPKNNDRLTAFDPGQPG